MKNALLIIFILSCAWLFGGCYSFTGATIEGKTLNIEPVENKSPNVVPTLAPTLTEKIRNRILSQTGLTPLTTDEVDYRIKTTVTGYNISIAGISGNNTVSQNRLSITISVDFKNNINKKQNFKTSFTRFRDFDGNTPIQNVENALIADIGEELADDIFNKAFVNW